MRNSDDIPVEEIKGTRDVLRSLINDSNLEYVLRLAIDVEMEEANKLFKEHKNRQETADFFSRKLNNKQD